MSDQGWMVDDGTCDQCFDGDCWDCADPVTWDAGDHLSLTCCCNEGYHIGSVDLDPTVQP